VEEYDPDFQYSQVVGRTARHEVRFNPDEAFPDNAQGVATIRGHEVRFSAEVHDVSKATDRKKGGTTLTPRNGSVGMGCPAGAGSPLAVLCAEGAVWMVIVKAERAYYFTFNSIPVTTTLPDGDTTEIHVPGFRVGPIPLPPEGEARLSGSRDFDLWNLKRPRARGSQRDSDPISDTVYRARFVEGIDEHVVGLQAVVSWNFEPPDLPEVILESDEYRRWIPEGNLDNPSSAGNHLTFRARVTKRDEPTSKSDKKVRIAFEFTEVSTEKGVCVNWPADGGAGDDLKILVEKNPSLEVGGSRAARTKSAVAEATLTVSALDFGAWGKMKVTAETESGTKVPVRFEGRKDPVITIPRNDNDQRTAAAWLEQKQIPGRPDNWDGAPAPRQVTTGDGLTVYAKYRGVVVIENGGRVYKRLDPNRKIHFVIDPGGVFAVSRWERTTDTTAYLVDDSLTRNRQVDFNGGYSGSGHKYAVRLTLIPGMLEPDPYPGMSPAADATYGQTVGNTPKTNERCRVFPDRIRDLVNRIIESIRIGVADPNSEDGTKLKALGITRDQAMKQLGGVDTERLARKMIELVAMHEMAHACAVAGHVEWRVEPKGEGWKETTNQTNASCPMQNFDAQANREFVLFGIFGGEGKLCDLCARQLNVKD
jgi:hypothetical protein